jgi:hypothetical protein
LLLLKVAGPVFEAGKRQILDAREQVSKHGGNYWLIRLRRIIALAPDRYIEQARHDWRTITQLIETVERVDWNKAPTLDPIGGKPKPPSWVARKARRIRPKPPPNFIGEPIETWRRDFNYRALLFCALLITRRLLARASMPQLPDFMLGIAQQWIDGLPQLPAAPA